MFLQNALQNYTINFEGNANGIKALFPCIV